MKSVPLLICVILSFCSVAFAQNQSEVDKIHQLVLERTKDIVGLFSNASPELELNESLLNDFAPFDRDNRNKKIWRIYDDIKIPDGVDNPISVNRYSDNIGFCDIYNASYNIRLLISTIQTIENRNYSSSAIPAATIQNDNGKIRVRFSPGFLISTYLKRDLVFAGPEEESQVERLNEYVNIVWFFKPEKKKGEYEFSTLTKEDFKLVGYGYVDESIAIRAKKEYWLDKWNTKIQEQASEQVSDLVQQYLDDVERSPLSTSEMRQTIAGKYFTSENAKIDYLSTADRTPISDGYLISYLNDYIIGKNTIGLETTNKSAANIQRNEKTGNSFAVVKTLDRFTVADSICTCGRNIVITFTYSNEELTNFKINEIVFANKSAPFYSCKPTDSNDLVRTNPGKDPTPPPPHTTPSGEYQIVKKKFEAEAPRKLEILLNAIEKELQGTSNNMEVIKNLFLHRGVNSKIRVTNHKHNYYDIYSVEDYFRHLKSLRDIYNSIDIQFEVDTSEIRPGQLVDKVSGRKIWTGKIQFTQTFKGLGAEPYGDRTIKTVNLIIYQDDDTREIFFDDIWFETTERL